MTTTKKETSNSYNRLYDVISEVTKDLLTNPMESKRKFNTQLKYWYIPSDVYVAYIREKLLEHRVLALFDEIESSFDYEEYNMPAHEPKGIHYTGKFSLELTDMDSNNVIKRTMTGAKVDRKEITLYGVSTTIQKYLLKMLFPCQDDYDPNDDSMGDFPSNGFSNATQQQAPSIRPLPTRTPAKNQFTPAVKQPEPQPVVEDSGKLTTEEIREVIGDALTGEIIRKLSTVKTSMTKLKDDKEALIKKLEDSCKLIDNSKDMSNTQKELGKASLMEHFNTLN